jgi:hypothetical protein
MSATGGFLPQIWVDDVSGGWAFAGEVDPVGVVDHPVDDRIGECRDADAFMMPPFLSVSCAAHEREAY